MKNGLIKRACAALSIMLLTIFLSAMNIYASQKELAVFDNGYDHYLAYQPEKAVECYQMFLSEFPDSSLKDAALFWLGRSFIMLQSFDEAKSIFLRLKNEIPDSPFTVYVDKELEKINTQTAGQKTISDIEQVRSEIQTLKNDRSEAERVLSETTADRDNLMLLLKEEKMKNKDLEAKAEKFDRELKDILSRLQAIRSVPENNQNSQMIPQEQKSERDHLTRETEPVLKEAVTEKTSSQKKIQPVEITKESPMGPLNTVQHKSAITQQSSSHTLELIANEETWIFVTIDDKDSKERLLKPGSRIKWIARNGFSLRVGNAGGIRVIFNGKDIGPLGEKGKVVKLKLPSLNLSNSKKDSSNVL